MNKIQELEIADRELRETSGRIDSIRHHLKNLDENLAVLNSIKLQFEENLAVLKSENIIPSMNEYKKIKDDLQSVHSRLYTITIDHSNHVSALERSEKMLLECRERYATLLKNQEAPVLRGNFGKK